MFEEKIKSFVSRIKGLKDSISTEEATKTSLIMPFFSLLGYDVFNPLEFIPEYTADVGIKKGERVDYTIMINDEPTILIEAKSVTEKLEKHDSQLFRYFGTTSAKFAILTNGIIYKFFTDLEEPNKMDLSPFLIVNLLELKDNDIAELKKFEKGTFDVSNILNTASDLKYCGLIKQFFKDECTNPSDDFTRLVLSAGIYEGRFTQNVVDKFKPIIKKSFSQYVNDLVNDKIKNALNIEDSDSPTAPMEKEPDICDPSNEINTTEDELQAYYIVKSILGETVDLDRIAYKDNLNYFAIILDGKVTRWICRVCLKDRVKYVIVPDGAENIRYSIDSVEDIYSLSKQIKARALSLM